MTRYDKGYAFEQRIRKYFESRKDFIYAMRSGGSKGAIDLIIVLKGMCYLIQCKVNGILGKSEWAVLNHLQYELDSWSDSFQILIAQQCKNTRPSTFEFRNLSGEVQEHL